VKSDNVVCAKCAKPTEGVVEWVGRFRYGVCCIDIVKARKEAIK
jgi:hypothetical protein